MPTLLVTTGATVTFKPLLDHVVTSSFLDFAISHNITSIFIQYGNEIVNGKHISKNYFNDLLNSSEIIEKYDLSIANETNDKSVTKFVSDSKNLSLSAFAFHNDIQSFVNQADIVVSHAGTGSILDCLRSLTPLVVVTNDALMDNHQVQIASQLEAANYLVSISSSELEGNKLEKAIGDILDGEHTFDAFPEANTDAVRGIVNEEAVKGEKSKR